MRCIEMVLSTRAVLRTDFYLFNFLKFTNRLILLALHFNLSHVTLLRLACSILMPCQLTLLALSTCWMCKLGWKSIMPIFFLLCYYGVDIVCAC